MSYSTIGTERRGQVLVITIDRPDSDLNAVDAALHHDLTRLFADLKSERTARAAVLTSRGTAFSAGGDFDWFPTLADRSALEALRVDARNLIYDLLDVPLPIVCAVGGPAVGLGASIALLCDVLFMAEEATIADPHVRVGIAAGDGGTVAWPLAVGPMLAKRYLLTGDPITAQDAYRLGLAAEVVPAGELDATAFAFAERLAAGAPLAIRYTKQAINAWVKDVAATAFDQAAALEIATFGTDDHAEALTALREKRPPHFEGR